MTRAAGAYRRSSPAAYQWSDRGSPSPALCRLSGAKPLLHIRRHSRPRLFTHATVHPMHLSDLKSKPVTELVEIANTNEIDGANRMRKHDLIFALLKNQAKKGESIFGDGTLEVLPDGFGFLRSPDTSYLAGTDDIYISPSQIRRFNLHTGDTIEGEIRTPKDGERYFALVKVDKVNSEPPENAKSKILFENLTPLFPDETLVLERDIKAEENITGAHHRHRRADRQGPARPARLARRNPARR